MVAVGSSPAASSLAAQLSCGETITADTTLDADLVGCPNHGLVIGADGITLDLGGHRIGGDGARFAGCGRRELCDVGVVNDGHDGVTITNGSVSDFDTGVLVATARRNLVAGISASGHRFFGIAVADSSRMVVRDSSWNRSPAPDGDGMGVFGSHHIRITGNAFRRNAQLGIHVVDSHDLEIRDNLLSHNTDMGLLMEADRNEVRGNRCVRNGECMILGPANRNVIVGNRAFGDGRGIAVEDGHDNLVARNRVVRPRGEGIVVGLERPPVGGPDNVVRGNLVRGSGRDGFRVSEKSRRTVLKANTAIAAGDDGFDIADGSATLTRNRARRSADLGIEAARGVIDGGGNVARRSGDPRRCTHIACA
jgi:parallel beta-helix repeat protein